MSGPAPDPNVSVWVTPKQFRHTFLGSFSRPQKAADDSLIPDTLTCFVRFASVTRGYNVFDASHDDKHLYLSSRLCVFTNLWRDVVKPRSFMERFWLLGGKSTLRRAV